MSRINQENSRRPLSDSRRFASLTNAELSQRMREIQAKVEAHFAEVEGRRSAWKDAIQSSAPSDGADPDERIERLSPVLRQSTKNRPTDVEFHLDA